jgi:membrane-associated protein
MEYILDLIQVAGYWGYAVLFVIIFLESFPPTFFLPGDSLLFTTGFLASQGHFELAILVPVLYVASTFGYMFSYAMGQKIRDFILQSNDRYWFKKKHLDQTHVFFERYGDKTIIIGRFIPVVRSFGPTLAGSVNMTYKKFIKGVFIGGILWTGGVTCLGYYLGKSIPGAHLYLTPIVAGIIFASLIPVIIEYFHIWKKKRTK